MNSLVAPKALKAWLHDGSEIALLDVREHGQFGEGHLFHAISLPYSRLEIDAPRLVPRRSTRVVVHDGGGGDTVGARAAARLQAMGYTAVHQLAGGVAAWQAAGLRLFKGVNLPSKTFGELVEQKRHTPRISATELARRQAAGDNLIVLDGRPLAEYRKMNVPGSSCCPNGELALRIEAIAPDRETTIVVNCAGRTRSIIGAQTLINLGVPNPVFALENGTQGWFLADLGLEHGATRRYPDRIPDDIKARARARAAMLAARHQVPTLPAATAQAWVDDDSRTCFVLDVRTEDEFRAGTLAGAAHAPGGQLLQATDQYVGVRGARLLVVDDDGIRAPVVASWLRQMGWDAAILAEGISTPLRLPVPMPLAAPALPTIDARSLAGMLDRSQVFVVDLRPSMACRDARIPGSHWSIRPRVVEDVRSTMAGGEQPVVLVADEPEVARVASKDLQEAGVADVRLLDGGFAAWKSAGLPVDASEAVPSDAECIDYLFFVHDRHSGNREAARLYLEWETGLIAQLDAAELEDFRIS